ncbi:NAD-dependent epimerase/dehydratase family protein [Bacillus sp. 2205SS5-2]|uniref:NAD-dependent epimerase/dehydratase family protein n=1 Tax=Bacillus sp. 2205SS5-2 TaxID=3109031 RepID=UPI003005D095
MKILVTGGAGFIGSHVVEALLKEGHTPVVLDDLSNSKLVNLPHHVTVYRTDLLSNKVEKVFKKEQPEIVIHMAAQISITKSIADPTEDAAINVLGTIKLLSYCIKYDVKKIIFSSSSAVYGETSDNPIHEKTLTQPISFYGTSKLVSESYIQLFEKLYKLPYTILRYANVYGPRQKSDGEGGVISIFINNILEGKSPTIYGDGLQTRDFVFVEDIANANLLALHHGENEILNIGTTSATSILQLHTLITQLLHSSLTPAFEPMRDGDIFHSQLNHDKAKQALHWEPKVSLATGIEKTIAFFD